MLLVVDFYEKRWIFAGKIPGFSGKLWILGQFSDAKVRGLPRVETKSMEELTARYGEMK